MDTNRTTLLLVRHATAGRRADWPGDDSARPLDERGRAQARELVGRLAGQRVARIVSSPYLRCLQTVEPLAEALGVRVEIADELVEGASADAVAGLAARVGDGAVLCTHGDVLEAVLGKGRPARKGSTWIVEHGAGGFLPVRYLAAPQGATVRT